MQRGGHKWAKDDRVDALDDDEWVGLVDAGELLGASPRRLTILLQADRLRPVHSRSGEAGVRKDSLVELADERQGAGMAKRDEYFIRDLARFVASHV